MQKIFIYEDTPVGILTIGEKEGWINYLIFGNEKFYDATYQIPHIKEETALIREAKKQLDEYFSGKRKSFQLPLRPEGTPFQKKVWEALLTIPYGEVASYKQIAEKSGSPKGARAVGMANNRNPISIIIPCHRVIGSTGNLVGYGGGLDVKVKLLTMEKANCQK